MSTETPYSFDQLAIGQTWDSEARIVTEADVRSFANLTGDHNPLHVDPEFARTTPFRQCIAHGLLGLSFAVGLLQNCPPTRTIAFLGLRDWRFLAPVFPGDVIRVRNQVESKELRGRGRRGAVVWRLQIRNQKDEIVQEGFTETLIETRPDKA